jgi:hypothetical protein
MLPIPLCSLSIFVVFHFVSEFFDYVMWEFVIMCNVTYGVPFFVFVLIIQWECDHSVYVVTVRCQFLFHWVIRGVANLISVFMGFL